MSSTPASTSSSSIGRGFSYFGLGWIANQGAVLAYSAATASAQATATLASVGGSAYVVIGSSLVVMPTAAAYSLYQGKSVRESMVDGATSPYWLTKKIYHAPGSVRAAISGYFWPAGTPVLVVPSKEFTKEGDPIQTQMMINPDGTIAMNLLPMEISSPVKKDVQTQMQLRTKEIILRASLASHRVL